VLSYHGWIPEAVHAITSISADSARSFAMPLGLFTFTRVPQRTLFSGVTRQAVEGGGSYHLAHPLKALADYVLARRLDRSGAAPVVQSLRVDEDLLAGLTVDAFDAVRRFVKRQELPSLELWSRDFFLAQCRKLGSATV
jgi:hypothetical protein